MTDITGCHLCGGFTTKDSEEHNFLIDNYHSLDDGIDSAWTTATKNMSPRELNRWRKKLFSIYVGNLPYDITKVILDVLLFHTLL